MLSSEEGVAGPHGQVQSQPSEQQPSGHVKESELVTTRGGGGAESLSLVPAGLVSTFSLLLHLLP